ncbi:MAG TPA: hypothetical protein VNQ73_12320 [Ilumatobacter sp.]|nr:hypothetical protein [Ilumatobacter sp.]
MSQLPERFSDLEPYVEKWALETENQRWLTRRTSTREELSEFYEVMLPFMEQILEECDRFALGELPPEYQPLFNLALALAEISPNVERYGGNPKVPFSYEESRLIAVHGDLPTWKALSIYDIKDAS